MKSEYPRYEQGQLIEIKKKISNENKQLLQKYLEHCSINAGKDKVEKIERDMVQVYDIIEKPFNKLKKEDIDGFLVLLNKSDRSFWTKNEIKVYLKKFCLWHYKDLDMVKNIKKTAKKYDDKKINESALITPEELEKMLRCAESFREKALLLLLWETGCRPQEILNLKWKDIKFEDDYTDIMLYSSKTNTTRNFPVKESTIHLKRWKQEYSYPNIKNDDYIFPSPIDRNKPLNSASINKILRKTAKKSGITKDVWAYLFRHTRATKLYEELPQQIVEKLLGHKDMASIYAHISNKKAREEMLKKIYNVQEINPEERKKLEKEIKELEKQVKLMVETNAKEKERWAQIEQRMMTLADQVKQRNAQKIKM